MSECKNCKSMNTTKNGKVRNKQRYKCKECGYNFVIGHAHYAPQRQALKALVALLYTLGKGSHRTLGKIFRVSNGTIRNWITEVADGLPEIKISEEITDMEFDEMWHYILCGGNIGKKNESCGSSKQLTELSEAQYVQVEWLRGYWASVTKKLSSDSTTK